MGLIKLKEVQVVSREGSMEQEIVKQGAEGCQEGLMEVKETSQTT
jgi:hypothetical protein